MRLFFLRFLVFALFFFTQFSVAVFAISALTPPIDCGIISILRIGSKGAEVQCLQGKLGISPDGNFGPLTKAAVISFQSKNGLVPDGVIGPLSRTALSVVIIKSSIYPAGCTSIIGYSSTTGVKCDGVLRTQASSAAKDDNLNSSVVTKNNTKNINSNLTNLDKFVATVVDVNKKKGSSETELKLIADSLKQTILTSNTDYNKEFKDLLERESKLSASVKTPTMSFFDKIKNKTLSFLGITPPTAQAETALPFGGALILPFFCPVSGNWMIAVEPLPPTYVALLSYFPATQGFANYNIPVTPFLLGLYVPAGVCSYGVVTIATEGTITPIVGSAPL